MGTFPVSKVGTLFKLRKKIDRFLNLIINVVVLFLHLQGRIFFFKEEERVVFTINKHRA